FYAIPKGKRYALLPGKPLNTFPGIALGPGAAERNSAPSQRVEVTACSRRVAPCLAVGCRLRGVSHRHP
ncbi:MAG: hypothetical protein EOS78_26610, partial [Mesorhizobium sp.]